MLNTLLFDLSVLGFLTLFFLGVPIIEAVSLTLFGYRPIGWWETVIPGFLYYFRGLPLYVRYLSMPLMRGRLRLRSRQNVALVLILLGGYGYFVGFMLLPALEERRHHNSWPAGLKLAHFEVCATEVKEGLIRKGIANGRIAFDIVNVSQSTLREATFTVRAGKHWNIPQGYRFAIRDLPPQGTRRMELAAELGEIYVPARRGNALIYWDHVRSEDSASPALVRYPENATVLMSDCKS